MPTRLPKPDHIEAVADVVDALGGPTAFARAVTELRLEWRDPKTGHSETIELKDTAASEMKRRNSMSIKYWMPTLVIAKRQGVALNAGDLLRIHGVDEAAAEAA